MKKSRKIYVKEREGLGFACELVSGDLTTVIDNLQNLAHDESGNLRRNPRLVTEWIQDGESEVYLEWERLETDQEQTRRLKKNKKQKEVSKANKAAQEKEERAEYERLCKKFEKQDYDRHHEKGDG